MTAAPVIVAGQQVLLQQNATVTPLTVYTYVSILIHNIILHCTTCMYTVCVKYLYIHTCMYIICIKENRCASNRTDVHNLSLGKTSDHTCTHV